MSDTIPAIEQSSLVISPEHVRELRVLLGEVRKQQYAPATCGDNNNAAVELAGYRNKPVPGWWQQPAPARGLHSGTRQPRSCGRSGWSLTTGSNLMIMVDLPDQLC